MRHNSLAGCADRGVNRAVESLTFPFNLLWLLLPTCKYAQQNVHYSFYRHWQQLSRVVHASVKAGKRHA